MSEYNFTVVPMNLILVLWDQLVPHLFPVVEVGNGEITLESIKARAMSNSSIIITVTLDDEIVAVTTAEVVTYDSGLRSLLIPVIGGKGLFDWGEDWWSMHVALAKDLGCTELRGLAVRSGWMKILKERGWVENHVVITHKLS